MQIHYFDKQVADYDDTILAMCKDQGYVPRTCLLGGQTVFGLVNSGADPCKGCNGPREKCYGRNK